MLISARLVPQGNPILLAVAGETWRPKALWLALWTGVSQPPQVLITVNPAVVPVAPMRLHRVAADDIEPGQFET